MFSRQWNKCVFNLIHETFRLAAGIAPPLHEELKGKSFNRILVFSTAGIGDTLSDSPAIRALKETFRDARITVVTHRRRSLIAAHNPLVDELVLYKKGPLSFFKNYILLKRKNFDLVVVLRANDPDIWPLAYLINRRAVVSCPVMTRMGFLISHPVILPEWDYTHGVEQTLDIVRAVGAETQDRRLIYEVKSEEGKRAEEMLAKLGIRSKPLVAFQVGGGKRGSYRDWGYRNYIAVGRRLLDDFDAGLILTGGKDNLEKANAIEEGIRDGNLANLAGRLSLSETAALLKQCKVLLSTDTGIMHLGFAVGDVDVLALIHCFNPASRVGPYGYGDKHAVVQLAPPPGQAPSMSMSLDGISPETVYGKLREMCMRKGIREKSG